MAKIFIYDEFGPEDAAMMQALYSRSPKSVAEHVEKVKQSGSGKFMSTFYVGYGHASIADCGSTTIFIEGVSILADKAIQDWPLYSGQETSTRYIDMTQQAIIDPIDSEASRAILKRWMDFYIAGLEKLKPYLIEKYPRREDEDEKVYLKAIAARSFDIMRGFLPSGITTQLSWHTNLRQAWDKLALLRHHPLPEVRAVAEEIIKQLKGKYENSFSHKLYEAQEAYRAETVSRYSYLPPTGAKDFAFRHNLDRDGLKKYSDILTTRPVKTGLPYFLGELGSCTFEFMLDFGSFRDIQRHRSAIIRMPLLTTQLGFQDWYLEQLPADLRAEAESLISEQIREIDKLPSDANVKQYYTAMGFKVFCVMTASLPSAVYVLELRSEKTVHPSLRHVAQAMYRALHESLPEISLYGDLDLDDWDVRRGLQDITAK